MESSRIVQRNGKKCATCDRVISIREKFDMYFIKHLNMWKEDRSWVNSMCECGCMVFYRNGAFKFTKKEDYKKEVALMKRLKGLKSMVTLKDGSIPDDELIELIKNGELEGTNENQRIISKRS